MYTVVILAGVLTAAYAQSNYQKTTPVPILKQINRHNDDGSYTYGYEGADGSFKIETKLATGEVQGKYGYIDADGKTRVIEYGASRRGFEPVGTDINVPPPVISGNNELDFDDGSYKEDPEVYNIAKQPNRRVSNVRSKAKIAPPAATAVPYYNPTPVAPQAQPYYTPTSAPSWYPAPRYDAHPNANIDFKTGSYSLTYVAG